MHLSAFCVCLLQEAKSAKIMKTFSKLVPQVSGEREVRKYDHLDIMLDNHNVQ